MPPLQQGGAHHTHRILNEMGRELDTALELQCCCSPHIFSLFDFTIRQLLTVTRGTQGCTVRPGSEYILLGTRQTPPQNKRDGAGVDFVHRALPPWFRVIFATNIFLSNSEWDLTEHIPP